MWILLLKIMTGGLYKSHVVIKIGFKSGIEKTFKMKSLEAKKIGNDLSGLSWEMADGQILYIRLEDISYVVKEK